MLPISCVTTESNPCPRATKCTTLPFWQGLQEVIEDYLRNVTLEDLAIQQKEAGCDYGAGI
ncbi:MAG: Rrf2 family transcriptional regulator, partial [Akkermansia sp.]